MRRAGLVLAALLAAWGATGCSTGAAREERPRPSVRAGEFGEPDCFLRQTVRDFQVLDDRNVIVFAPGRADAYHVQVNPPSVQLRFAEVLGFESRNSRICGYAGDALVVANAGPGAARLSVTGVFRLDAAALQGLQARFGKAVQPGIQEPRPGPGAEIERDVGSPPP